jgi:peptide deformylase
MPERSIVLYPNPILRKQAEAVAQGDERVKAVVQDLLDTLDSHVGVGIAAPQIGESVRIIAIDATRARRPVRNHGRLVLVNPEIVAREGRTSFREGCMSVPDLVAQIERSERVTVAAHKPDGEPLTIMAEGFEAVILQHEIDHLDGILFIDRVHSARDLKPRGGK